MLLGLIYAMKASNPGSDSVIIHILPGRALEGAREWGQTVSLSLQTLLLTSSRALSKKSSRSSRAV